MPESAFEAKAAVKLGERHFRDVPNSDDLQQLHIPPTTAERSKLTFSLRSAALERLILTIHLVQWRMAMKNPENGNTPTASREPWNKGKLIGQKPPFRRKHVWSIRTKLQIDRRVRDLAMFNLAIDSKLRGRDVVGLRVEDVAPSGYARDRATEEDRAARQIRTDGTDTASSRRLHQSS